MTDTTLSTFVAILLAAAAAPMLSELLAGRIHVPSVVLELAGGILVGPVLHWAHDDQVIGFLSQLGLAMLMFFAGLEVDLARIGVPPLRRAIGGWTLSLALGIALGLTLTGIDGPRSGLIVGLAVTTTALGTLLPILKDSGELTTPFGTEVLAGATVGELGPLVAVALLLSTDRALHTVVVLAALVVVALGTATLARRPRAPRLVRLIEVTLTTSGQLAVRLMALLVGAMVWVAAELGLDLLLGAFAAGMVFRLFSAGAGEREAELVEAKLLGLGFGFLIPIFFVVSGIRFDLDSFVEEPMILLAVPAFLIAFLVVRGGPAFVLGRGRTVREGLALACYMATALPLVVVVTGIGVETGRLRTSIAAALVGAAMLSVLTLPLAAARLRRIPGEALASGLYG